MIVIKNLRKIYYGKIAVDDISFTVETGKVTGFLGPNGAGKSTTMRLMLGLDNGNGVTLFDDKPLHAYPEPARVIGFLLDAKSSYPARSARNHLRVLAATSNISNERVDEVLEIVGLSAVAHRSPGKFSLGMNQRLGIAGAILNDPQYLMLDEPANGLDPEGIVWLRDFLKDYAARGKGVFVSSHLLSEMSLMADNVVVIGRGKMIADTSIEQIIAQNSIASVFIRVDKPELFKKSLQDKHIIFTEKDKGFVIEKVSSDDIGDIAFDAHVRVHELANHRASLEEAFLELTADSEEYHARPKKGNKK